jgi:hypothetical protein
LISVRDTESRYRLTSQRLLPQFGPTRNPFSAAGNVEPPAATEIRQGAASDKVSPKVIAWGRARALWLRAAVWWSGWKAKLGLQFARRPDEVPKPGIPQFPKLPVQGELSLDRVRVVRNDLSDADLEVVPASSRRAPALLEVGPVRAAESAWERVRPNLFRVGKT